MNSAGNFPFINLYSIFDAKRNWENRAGAGSAQIPIYQTEYKTSSVEDAFFFGAIFYLALVFMNFTFMYNSPLKK